MPERDCERSSDEEGATGKGGKKGDRAFRKVEKGRGLRDERRSRRRVCARTRRQGGRKEGRRRVRERGERRVETFRAREDKVDAGWLRGWKKDEGRRDRSGSS